MHIRKDITDVAIAAKKVQALAHGNTARCAAPFPNVLNERPVFALRPLMVPGVQQVIGHHPDGDEYVLADPATGSWARARKDTKGEGSVAEEGPRRLWDELCAITDDWLTHSRPALTSYGLTVTPDDAHTLWFGAPDGPTWHLS